MSLTAAQMDERPGVVERFVHWWQHWTLKYRIRYDLDQQGPDGIERIAHDLGIGRAELRTLAGRWPESPDLLQRRMCELRLDPADIRRHEPQVMRDLQRTCSLCASDRQCRHDLAQHRSDARWRKYCPNLMTLDALLSERAGRTSD